MQWPAQLDGGIEESHDSDVSVFSAAGLSFTVLVFGKLATISFSVLSFKNSELLSYSSY